MQDSKRDLVHKPVDLRLALLLGFENDCADVNKERKILLWNSLPYLSEPSSCQIYHNLLQLH